MDERAILIVCFAVGVAMQAAILIHGEWNWPRLIGCAAFGLVGMIPDKHEYVYQPLFHILTCISIFAFLFAFAFRRIILPIVSEPVLLSYTIIFWFAFFVYYYDGTPPQRKLMYLLLAPSAISLYVSLVKTQLGFGLKLILYTWFLIIIVCLGLFQFPFDQLTLFYDDHQVPWVTPAESVMAGMAFLFLLVNGTYVFYLIPIPGRTQSWKDRMKEWHEFTDLLTQRFAGSQITLAQSSMVLFVEGIALLLNTIYQWLPAGLIINLAIVIPGLIFHPKLMPAPMQTSLPQDKAPPPRVPHSRHLLKGKYRRKLGS